MNLPNKLTLLRILFIPAIVTVYYIDSLSNEMIGDLTLTNFLILIFFALASFTDFLDGYLARKLNQVTSFGKFADPLADKLLVTTSLLLFLADGIIPAWMLIVILSREFMVTGIRLVAVGEGNVIAASKLGKYKTASTMFAIIFIYLEPITGMVGMYLMYLAVVLTVISGLDYLLKNKKIIFESM